MTNGTIDKGELWLMRWKSVRIVLNGKWAF